MEHRFRDLRSGGLVLFGPLLGYCGDLSASPPQDVTDARHRHPDAARQQHSDTSCTQFHRVDWTKQRGMLRRGPTEACRCVPRFESSCRRTSSVGLVHLRFRGWTGWTPSFRCFDMLLYAMYHVDRRHDADYRDPRPSLLLGCKYSFPSADLPLVYSNLVWYSTFNDICYDSISDI
jgi:hypothetical protein